MFFLLLNSTHSRKEHRLRASWCEPEGKKYSRQSLLPWTRPWSAVPDILHFTIRVCNRLIVFCCNSIIRTASTEQEQIHLVDKIVDHIQRADSSFYVCLKYQFKHVICNIIVLMQIKASSDLKRFGKWRFQCLRGFTLNKLICDADFLKQLFAIVPTFDASKFKYINKVWFGFCEIQRYLNEYTLSIGIDALQTKIERWCELLLGTRLPSTEGSSTLYTHEPPSAEESLFAQELFGSRFFVPYVHLLLTHFVFYINFLGTLKLGELQRVENLNQNVRRVVKNTNQHRDTMFEAALSAQIQNILMPEQRCATANEDCFSCQYCPSSLGNQGALHAHLKSHFRSDFDDSTDEFLADQRDPDAQAWAHAADLLLKRFPNPNTKDSKFYDFLTCDNLVVGDPGTYEDIFDDEVESE